MTLTFSECVQWRQYYDSAGYPDIASLYATHSCGNRIVGLIVVTIIATILVAVYIKERRKKKQ